MTEGAITAIPWHPSVKSQQLALSRLAAQHQEIMRLRAIRIPVGVSDLDSARASRTIRPPGIPPDATQPPGNIAVGWPGTAAVLR